jgi:molybdopterin-guanine dinucleotide biosynthesis protein A
MPYKNNLAAIILAGGRSSRMGTDKGLILFQGKALVTHVIDVLRSLGINNIIIITQHGAYEQFGYPCYPDLVQDKGPLGGIYAGMIHSKAGKNLVLACDMPFLTKELITALIDRIGEEDALITQHNGKDEPLCSVYSSSCIPHFKEKLDKDQLKITSALDGLAIRNISFDDQPWFHGNEFSNLNTPAELNKHQQ